MRYRWTIVFTVLRWKINSAQIYGTSNSMWYKYHYRSYICTLWFTSGSCTVWRSTTGAVAVTPCGAGCRQQNSLSAGGGGGGGEAGPDPTPADVPRGAAGLAYGRPADSGTAAAATSAIQPDSRFPDMYCSQQQISKWRRVIGFCEGKESTGFLRGLENLECALLLFSEFKALKVLGFPKLVLKSLEFVTVNLSHHINICRHIYGIVDVSKRVNIASKRVIMASRNVPSHKYQFVSDFCVFYC